MKKKERNIKYLAVNSQGKNPLLCTKILELTNDVKLEPKNNSMQCEHKCAETNITQCSVNHQELNRKIR